MRDRGDPSLPGVPPRHEDTYGTRLARLKRQERQIVAVGAGLTAFVVALAAGDAANGIYGDGPGWLRAMIFSLVIVAGASLAFAYLRFEEATERLEDAIENRPDLAATPIGDRWTPQHADAFWIVGLACTALAPLAFLIAAWWAAF